MTTGDVEVLKKLGITISEPIAVYCQGTKKKTNIPCRRYLGEVDGKAELLCPICKTVNVVEDGKVTVKKREGKLNEAENI